MIYKLPLQLNTPYEGFHPIESSESSESHIGVHVITHRNEQNADAAG